MNFIDDIMYMEEEKNVKCDLVGGQTNKQTNIQTDRQRQKRQMNKACF